MLYISYDDRQSLLPYRARYPIEMPPLDLSRNCRNGGSIFQVMRKLVPDSPLPEQLLANLGDVGSFPMEYGQNSLTGAVHHALAWLDGHEALGFATAVLGGSVPFEQSVLAGQEFTLGASVSWQQAVASELRRAAHEWSQIGP